MSEKEEKIYRFICENPGLSTYDISKKLNLSGGCVRHCLAKLSQKGLIFFKFEKNNPRIRKLSYPINAFKLLPRKILNQLKSFLK
jgi:predicted transcriptional regulator